MKKQIMMLFAALLLAAGMMFAGCSGQDNPVSQSPAPGAGQTPEATPAPMWTVVNDIKMNSMYNINVAGFANENVGMTVGYGGEMHYTKDGGKTWKYGSNSSACRYSLGILDDKTAWSGGNGNQICVTNDGGEKWTKPGMFNGGSFHTHISYMDYKNGWISTNRKLAATQDGGQTWSEIPLPEGFDNIASLYLRTAQDGYVLSAEGQLATTKDGGATWAVQDLDFKQFNLSTPSGKEDALTLGNVSVAEIAFTDEHNGVVAFVGKVDGEGQKAFSMMTADGGSSWTTEKLEPVEKFMPSALTLSHDGRYLTLSSGGLRLVVMKRN